MGVARTTGRVGVRAAAAVWRGSRRTVAASARASTGSAALHRRMQVTNRDLEGVLDLLAVELQQLRDDNAALRANNAALRSQLARTGMTPDA